MTRCGDVFGEDGAGLGGITVVGVVVKRVEVGPLAAVEETDVGEVAVSREEVLEFVHSGHSSAIIVCTGYLLDSVDCDWSRSRGGVSCAERV